MYTTGQRQAMIDRIRCLPNELEACISGLTEEQLTTHFIEGEWTVAQNVHHLADSHTNSYIRFKLTLAEENPPLKPYDQDVWADMVDATSGDITSSLILLRGLHSRWANLLEGFSDEDWIAPATIPSMANNRLKTCWNYMPGTGTDILPR